MPRAVSRETLIETLPDILPADTDPAYVGEAVREITARLDAGPIQGGSLTVPTRGGTLYLYAEGDRFRPEFVPGAGAAPAAHHAAPEAHDEAHDAPEPPEAVHPTP